MFIAPGDEKIQGGFDEQQQRGADQQCSHCHGQQGTGGTGQAGMSRGHSRAAAGRESPSVLTPEASQCCHAGVTVLWLVWFQPSALRVASQRAA